MAMEPELAFNWGQLRLCVKVFVEVLVKEPSVVNNPTKSGHVQRPDLLVKQISFYLKSRVDEEKKLEVKPMDMDVIDSSDDDKPQRHRTVSRRLMAPFSLSTTTPVASSADVCALQPLLSS